MKTPEGTPITPKVEALLKYHDCGNRDQDNYGDDWSHYGIEQLVELACLLEKQLKEEVEKAFREGFTYGIHEGERHPNDRKTVGICFDHSNARKVVEGT